MERSRFPPSCQDLVFSLQQEKSLDQLIKLCEGGTMEAFEGLESKYYLQHFHFICYLQIRHDIPKNMRAPNVFFTEDFLK